METPPDTFFFKPGADCEPDALLTLPNNISYIKGENIDKQCIAGVILLL